MSEAATPEVISTNTVPSVTHESHASEQKPVDLTQSTGKVRAISAAEKLGLRPKGQIQGPKEALGGHATPTAQVKADIKRLKERHAGRIVNVPRADMPSAEQKGKLADRQRDASGKLLPKDGVAAPDNGATPAPASEKPAEPKADAPAPAPEPRKIKVGDKELTEEEMARRLLELEEKAAAKDKKPEQEKTETDRQKQSEEARKALETKRGEYITKAVESLGISDEKTLDSILAGGPEAVAKFNDVMSKLVAKICETREYVLEATGAEFAKLGGKLQPILDQQREIESYRTESAFLGKFPEIKENPKAIEESRKVRAEMAGYYDSIQQKIAQNIATAEERQHAERYERATSEQFDQSVAEYTRERLGLNKPPLADPVAQAAPVTAPPQPAPKPAPKPPAGQAVGGASTPRAMTDQQRHVAQFASMRQR